MMMMVMMMMIIITTTTITIIQTYPLAKRKKLLKYTHNAVLS
jgi:hypothetical protein